jgi:ribosomal protein L11 methyltransferase
VRYRSLAYLVPPPLEEAVTAALWDAGTLGIETRAAADGRIAVEAWFAGENASTGTDPLAGRVAEGAVETLPPRQVDEADWLAAYREQARPFPLGRGFWVDPREPSAAGSRDGGSGEGGGEAPSGRRLLRLPARTAFGIGSHESTRLAVALLEDAEVAGRRVLDVGAGTGILAFAALALGAASAVAFDVDAGAMVHARANARLNGVAPPLFAGVVESLRPTPRFDLAVVNIIPEVIVPEMPGIALLLGSGDAGGEMILSGILAERGDEVLAGAAAAGFAERARRRDGDWVGFRVGREEAPR